MALTSPAVVEAASSEWISAERPEDRGPVISEIAPRGSPGSRPADPAAMASKLGRRVWKFQRTAEWSAEDISYFHLFAYQDYPTAGAGVKAYYGTA
jgi:hypothetical protein